MFFLLSCEVSQQWVGFYHSSETHRRKCRLTCTKTVRLHRLSLQKDRRKPEIHILNIQVDISMPHAIILSGPLYTLCDYFTGSWLTTENYSFQVWKYPSFSKGQKYPAIQVKFHFECPIWLILTDVKLSRRDEHVGSSQSHSAGLQLPVTVLVESRIPKMAYSTNQA